MLFAGPSKGCVLERLERRFVISGPQASDDQAAKKAGDDSDSNREVLLHRRSLLVSALEDEGSLDRPTLQDGLECE